MISSLKGKINRIWGNNCEVCVNDVGYMFFIGKSFIKKHVVGEEITVQTYMAVSENDVSLFGFDSHEEVDLFKMLISVSGIGPRTGAQILGETNPGEIIKAIGNADVEFFENIKGIGKKTAQRIIVDLKSKIGGLGELNLKEEGSKEEDDVYLSLKQLGFDKKEIEKVTKKLPDDIASVEEKLSWCLRNLG